MVNGSNLVGTLPAIHAGTPVEEQSGRRPPRTRAGGPVPYLRVDHGSARKVEVSA